VYLPGPGSRPEAGEGGALYTGRVDTVYRYRVDTVYVREGSRIILFDIVFDLDMASLRPDARRLLDLDAQILLDHPNLVVEVQGHTDSQADDDYNMDLSIRRAEAVRDYFVSKGVAPERLSTRGFGERQPIDTNATPEGRQRNRRIELLVIKN
jgi:outer membrane protein OmpA-like peptidoglycan-associated protein